MGIRLLNTFLQNNAKNKTKKIHLRSLRGKRIVIDASIYMYRFAATGNLIENIYTMCSIFRYYGIHVIFIFDGSYRREEKDRTLRNRQNQKERAKEKYKRYETQLDKLNDGDFKENLITKMSELRRTFITITKKDIDDVKSLLDAYGIMYRNAEGEADELCAAIVTNKMAYACLSEDTDLFAYGCPRVLKYISLINHTAIMYKLSDILPGLNISFSDFKTLCLCSGTDYLRAYRNIFQNYDLYRSYSNWHSTKNSTSFLDWLKCNKYLTSSECQIIESEDIQYDQNVLNALNTQEYFLIRNKSFESTDLKKILQENGFIFPE